MSAARPTAAPASALALALALATGAASAGPLPPVFEPIGEQRVAADPDAFEAGTPGPVGRTPGRAYLFERVGGAWRERARVGPARADDFGFGSDVSLEGGALAVLSALRTSAFDVSGDVGADGAVAVGAVEATGTAIDLDADRLAVGRYLAEGASVYANLPPR